ncbi:MAG: hypothetical protein AAGA69_10875, partial [Pseudomonadota bacterium]
MQIMTKVKVKHTDQDMVFKYPWMWSGLFVLLLAVSFYQSSKLMSDEDYINARTAVATSFLPTLILISACVLIGIREYSRLKPKIHLPGIAAIVSGLSLIPLGILLVLEIAPEAPGG